jgi:hypothetical protein
MQFGAHLLSISIPLLYLGFSIYLIINPFDNFKVKDRNGKEEVIEFNTGALIFAYLLQIAIWILFIVHGVVSIIIIKRDSETAVNYLDALLISNSVPVLTVFFVFWIIRITVYTVGMQDWIEWKTTQIDKTETFSIDGERDIRFGPNERSGSIAWINFMFIFPGIVIPWITFYILFFIFFLTLGVLNGIHKKKITDRDDYIKTLYYSKIIQEYIEQLRNSESSELNNRDVIR